jgi:aerobic C4-dicarboxylate transport protein
VKGEVLQILFVAVLFGLALCQIGDRAKPLVSILDQVAKALFAMVRVIMYFAPIGAGAAIAFTVGKFGVKTLIDLGQFVFAVFAVCLGFIVVVFGFLLRLCGFRLSRVFAYFKEKILFVFAAIIRGDDAPLHRKTRTVGLFERGRRFGRACGILLQHGRGRDLHGDGGPFITHATNIDLSMSQQFVMLFVVLFTSKGVVGVTGGGFVALAATIPAVGILPVAGLTLLLGVDRFVSEIREAGNVTSNIVATLVVARWTGAIDLALAKRISGGRKARRARGPGRRNP